MVLDITPNTKFVYSLRRLRRLLSLFSDSRTYVYEVGNYRMKKTYN